MARFSEDLLAELRCSDGIGRPIHVWQPERPRAVLLAIHGGLAHGGDWVTPASYFRQRGWATVSFDMHGHDRKTKAHIPRFACFLDDIQLFLAWVKQQYVGLPIVVLSHSMGALIAAHFALSRLPQGDPAIRGYVMSSPYLGNVVQVPRLLMWLAGPMSLLFPRMTVPAQDIAAYLTHDPVIAARHRQDEQDEIRARHASVRFGHELLKAQRYVADNIGRWNQPLFAVVAGDDRLADVKVTERLLGQIEPRFLERHHYPGNYHENFNELNREEIFAKMDDWFARKLGMEGLAPARDASRTSPTSGT
jgi:alpha-beta hydrolase superfamily lysophospholipase